jgi:hypothetical protein
LHRITEYERLVCDVLALLTVHKPARTITQKTKPRVLLLIVYRLLDMPSIRCHNDAMTDTPKPTTRLTLRFDAVDMDLIEQLKKDYNVRSTIGAIRIALRLAQIERFPAPREEKK